MKNKFTRNSDRLIHETVIRDIVDVVTDVKDSDELKGIFSNNSYRSLTKATQKLTMVFPVLIDNTIPLEQATMIQKAIERKATAMLQMLFSAINITDSKNAMDYIGQFHRNINFKDNEFGVDEFIDGLDSFVQSNPEFMESMQNAIRIDTKIVNEDCKRNINNYLPLYPESNYSVNDFSVDQRLKLNNPMAVTMNEGSPSTVITNMKNVADYRQKITSGYKDQVIATDYNKANELNPTLMVINFVTSDGVNTPIASHAVVGVKAKLYPISQEDIQDRIAIKNKDRHGLFNFVRACTREISFWKDFIFAIDRAKMDAFSNSKRGSSSSAWKILERRAIKSKIKTSFGLNNDASAITTLVISKNVVETLKKEENIHIDKESILAPIMIAYNLMGIAIVDDVNEKVKFLFDDGENKFETISFTALEREKSDNSYKKIVNLMTKMSR